MVIIAQDSNNVARFLLTDSFGRLITESMFNKTMIKKTYAWAGAVTGQAVWTPASGKKFVITDIILSASANCTVTLFDNTDNTTNRIMKLYLTSNQVVTHNFSIPVTSSTANNVLKITTSAAGGDITVFGYEV